MAKHIPQLGRPLAFENPQQLLDMFLDYVDDCINNNELPNVAGFRASKMIPRSTYYKYEANELFVDVFDSIKDIIEDKTINNENADSQIKKLILSSKFNYADKIDNKIMLENVTVELKKST